MTSSIDEAELLRVTLASIGNGVITTDARGNVTMLNSVAQTLTGWAQEDAVGQPLTAVFHIVNQDTRADVENPALRALRDGLIVGLANHTLLIARDGTERNIDDSAAPIITDAGGLAGAVLVFRDITARYEQERLVVDGRAYAENILSTLRHAFLVLDQDLRIVSANRSFYQRFQIEDGQADGRLLYEVGEGEWNIPKLRELLEEILPDNHHTIEDFEVTHDFPRIGHKVMSLNARRVNKPGNHSNLILLVIEDITERRVAETKVRESETRYRRLFQSAKDGILILDAHTGKITDANAFIGGLVGVEAHLLLGKELHEIGLFGDTERSREAFRTLQENRYIRYEHLPLQNQSGGTVEVEVVANVYHEDSELVAQCNVRDISQRVVMEQKITQQTEQLADQSRRKDEFLAMLSHELRNPLAPIRSAVHLLRTQANPAGENLIQKQAHQVIQRQVDNLTKIVNDLLEVSRVVSGRIWMDRQIIEMNEVLRHAVETVMPLIEQRQHELVLNLCPDPVWANADATRMEEVFINLLNNAAKYTPDGGRIEVWCEAARNARGDAVAQIRIRDNGIGIGKELLDAPPGSPPPLFDLFTQADRSLARSAGGLGIGLSLAHRLVELHGGTIEAISPPRDAETGTELIVCLPSVLAPATIQEVPREQDRSANADGIRVLVVDDNVDLVMMLAALLRAKGYSVESAYTGPDGLQIALQWRPDVVLLDIGLPGLDGYEVARRIRSDAGATGRDAIPRLVAMSGYGREADVATARDSGFDAHLTKPIEFEALEGAMSARGGR